MSGPDNWRGRAIGVLERRLGRESFPRLIVLALLLVTGETGFLASMLMLRVGVHAMWVRYPIAVLLAYAMFLLLLRCWAEWVRRVADPAETLRAIESAPPDHPAPEIPRNPDRGSWFDWVDVPVDFGDLDEGCLPVILFAVAAGVGLALIGVVIAAPALLAEVLLDAVLVAALSRRLRGIERRHWVAGAIRRTWVPAVCVAVVLAIAGALCQAIVPEARSIGQVWRKIVRRG